MTISSLVQLSGSLEVPSIGRRSLTLDEFANQFGPGTEFCNNERRMLIWGHFIRATEMLRSSIDVAAVWIGGSFITNKPDPNDVDAVYILNENKYSNLDVSGKQRVAGFGTDGWLFERSIRVDSHILGWRPHAELDHRNPAQHEYLKSRGYWDDFLQRYAEDKKSPLTEASAIPKRGYLEVILDGYDS
ncbi:DUF6932 family protein [Glutamicibacter nicotianae]|uniref:DUF6932 family protein n=1 Tax=Glutamicibacter nicotianae TaxID=37929 RepID=UPI00167F21DA|nr:hypothetical protein [Glutamicibacter nicotianae]